MKHVCGEKKCVEKSVHSKQHLIHATWIKVVIWYIEKNLAKCHKNIRTCTMGLLV